MTIGKKIKDLRTELNMSVDELAEKLGKNRATIYRYEKGDIGNLPLDVLEPLATALQTTPGYLMGWDDKDDKDTLGVGDLLKLMRKQRNMSVEDFSNVLGIDPDLFRKYETGEKYIPISIINMISEYYRLATRSYVENVGEVDEVRKDRFKEWAEAFGHANFTDEEYRKVFEYCKFLIYLRDEKEKGVN